MISLNMSLPLTFFTDTREHWCFELHITQSHLYDLYKISSGFWLHVGKPSNLSIVEEFPSNFWHNFKYSATFGGTVNTMLTVLVRRNWIGLEPL